MVEDVNTTALFFECGSMEMGHIERILPEFQNTEIPVVCEPSAESFSEVLKISHKNDRSMAHNEPDLKNNHNSNMPTFFNQGLVYALP